jgi:hypothetical protein
MEKCRKGASVLLEAFLFKISSPNRPALHAAPARRAKLLAFVFILIAGLLGTVRAHAQTTATVDGIVRDTDKALIPNAQIVMINEQDKSRRTTTSNAEGYFTLTALRPGTYDLTVTEKGFEKYQVTGISVHPGDSVDIPRIELKIGEISQEITVTAAGAGVNLDSPERSSVITAEDINRISTVGRDATELIRFLPGFAAATGGGLSNVPSWQASQNAGFGGSSLTSFSANGATPQTGATTVVSDGASVMDPGDMGASIQNVNMNQVQEISVETSNFGADQAKGPVVINAVGKSGTSNYHGEVYMVARNTVLNSNDWYSNFEGVARPQTKYFYPGVDVSGPIKIPGTNFNHSKKLTFFGAFEYYDQTVPDGQATNGTTGLVQSFIPTIATATTPGMLTPMASAASGYVGDLTPSTIASALNISVAQLQGACPNFYTTNGVKNATLNGSGGICYSPGSLNGSEYTQQDCIYAGGIIQGNSPNAPASNAINCPTGSLLPVDPHALIWAKYWPKPNRTPQAVPIQGLISDGFNYEKTILNTLNGYQLRGRVDDSITDSLKFYVTYNFEKVNSEIAIDNVYYPGSDIIPYPTPAFTETKSNGVSINLTKVVGATLTNEAIFAGAYYYSPNQLQNRASMQDSATGWSGGRYYNNNALQLPGIRDYENGVPDFAMGYFPAGSAFLRKFSYDGADNLTKQIRTHSVKVGVYAEVTANNQVPYNFTQGLYTFNHYNAGCYTNDGSGDVSQLQNNVGNLFDTCSGFSQSSSSINADLHFRNIDFYATDEWKATKRLTLTFGLRFDHQGAWYDPDGLGMAVWTPPAEHVLYPVTQDPHTYPGISWHQTDKSDPISGQASRALFYSPRVGLAYDLYGDGKTTLRGGWGAYRFHDSYNDSAGPLGTTQGIQNFAVSSNLSCTLLQVQNQGAGITGNGVGCPTTGTPFSIYALDKNDTEQPVTYNYNFTVDQALPFNSNFEVGYVGNQSAHTFTEGNLSNQNYIPLGGLFQPDPLTGTVTQPSSNQQVQQDYYPYPNYTTVYVPHHIGYGNYNALQASFTKQKGRFLLRANYTWAKALGIRGDYRTGAVGDPSNLRNNYGYLGFNRNNAVNFVYSYQFGKVVQNKLLGGVVNNWEIDGVTQIQSGPDVGVLTGNGNFSLSGGVSYTPAGSTTQVQIPVNNTDYLGTPNINLQPTVLCDPRVNLHNQPGLGHQYFNGACFGLPKFGTNGDFELPDTHGPALFDSDLTVRRTFKFTEKQNLQISVAGFNFINHPLYAFTGGTNIGLGLGFGSPAVNTATTPAQAFASAVQTTTNFGYTPYKEGFRIVTLQAKYSF